jgi:hypothetical protein
MQYGNKQAVEKERIPYNTTLNAALLKRLKYLAVELNKRHNELLDEAIEDILNKYGKETTQPTASEKK